MDRAPKRSLFDRVADGWESANRSNGGFVRARSHPADMVKEVRRALSRETAKARRRGLPSRTLEVGLTSCEAGSDDVPAVAVGIGALGTLSEITRVDFTAESADDVVAAFAEMRDEQEDRLAVRERLATLDADVMIDAVTLAALEDGGIRPAHAIADLRANDVTIIDLDVRQGRLVLYVRNCVVTGNVPLGDGMRWQEGRLTVSKDGSLPLEKIRGKPLRQILAHDYFEDDARIGNASEFGDSVRMHVEPRQVAVRLDERSKAA